MPEGPEIHREADKIRDALKNKTVSYLYFYHDHLKPYEKELAGHTVQSVEAHGKGLVIGFENDYWFFSHNQLYGKWFIKPAGDYPDTNRQLRAEIQNHTHSALLYSASEIDIMDGESIDEHPYLSKLGPDILKPIEPQEILDRLKSDNFRRKSFASLFLNQEFLSGIGNYLRSEILFDAKIAPRKRPMDYNDEKLFELSKSAITISHRAYQTGGITADDEFVREQKSKGAKRKTYRHYAFSGADKPCPNCSTPIIKEKISGRRLYYCPDCIE